MDETAVRAYFERAARAELPPSTVDVAGARRAGRRRLAIRRIRLPVMLLGVVAAAGLLFASGVLPVGATGHRAAARRSHHRSAFTAPASFDPLAIWATFGWLPPGYSVIAPPDGESTTISEMDAAGPHGRTVTLMVFAARQCELAGPAKRHAVSLRCEPGLPLLAGSFIPAGHLADGDPAYWITGINGQRLALAWQYARSGWAIAEWPGARPAELIRLAAHVRYRARLRFPFPFSLAGIPASWKLSGTGYQEMRGKVVGYALYMGPSRDPGGVRLIVQPAFQPACVFSAGQIKNVSFDGAQGVLVSTPSEDRQDVCFPSLHGMFVWGGLHDPLGGAMGLLRYVRVLGPDPVDWTTHPLG